MWSGSPGLLRHGYQCFGSLPLGRAAMDTQDTPALGQLHDIPLSEYLDGPMKHPTDTPARNRARGYLRGERN